MGVVYKARQIGLNRIVALKMILAGAHATSEQLNQFKREAESVARHQHPNIVQIHEIGEQSGLPFFSLEFVEGGSLKERLAGTPVIPRTAAQFVKTLAQAIHYAHEQKIVHRDLKPENILLAGSRDDPLEKCTPKIADFGLAKQVDTEGATGTGIIAGTPSYMAPEQAKGLGRQIGPLADVWALGAIHYEMLTGRPPFRAATALDTVLQVINDEPVPPSRLQSKTPRDLETICLKCLEKEPSRRYATAEALAEDLGRFLKGEPVLARPVSAIGRGWRWCRRKPAHAAAWGFSVLLAVAAIVVPTIFAALVWQHGNELADKNMELLVANQKESRSRQRAEKSLEYFVSTFRRADPVEDGEKVTIMEALRRSEQDLLSNDSLDPESRAALLNAIGNTYAGLGRYAEAIPVLEHARRLVNECLGSDSPEALTVVHNLAAAYLEVGQRSEAVALYEKAVRGKERSLGKDHPATLQSMNNLADAYQEVGRLTEALALHEETRNLRAATLGPDHADTLESMSNLATSYSAAGRHHEAMQLYEGVFRLEKAKFGPEHPKTLIAMGNLALSYLKNGRASDAMPLFEATLEGQKSKLPPGHPHTLVTMNNLADALRADGRLTDSLRLFEETVKQKRQYLGGDHPSTLGAENNFAQALFECGRPADAMPVFEAVLRRQRAILGENHPDTLVTMNNLADVYRAVGRLPEAIQLFEETLKLDKSIHGPDHPGTLATMNNLGNAYLAARRASDALPLLEETLKGARARLGSEHPHTLATMHNVARALHASRRRAKAVTLYEEALRLRKVRLGADHPDTLTTMNNLALVYRDLGRLSEAAALFEDALRLLEPKLGGDNPKTLTTKFNLATVYGRLKQYARAERHFLDCDYAINRDATNIPPGLREDVCLHVAFLYDAWGKTEQAGQWRAKLPPAVRIPEALMRNQAWPLLWGWPRF
jgi:tetratricopeptide (TPR) repeat protein